MLDWWQKREVERTLAHELHIAQERFRVANLGWRDLTDFANFGRRDPDSDLRTKQAQEASVQAYDEWIVALDRWTNFVKHGTIPEDAGRTKEASPE